LGASKLQAEYRVTSGSSTDKDHLVQAWALHYQGKQQDN